MHAKEIEKSQQNIASTQVLIQNAYSILVGVHQNITIILNKKKRKKNYLSGQKKNYEGVIATLQGNLL
jgi:hypothetical protein